jgi:hypothetical protein
MLNTYSNPDSTHISGILHIELSEPLIIEANGREIFALDEEGNLTIAGVLTSASVPAPVQPLDTPAPAQPKTKIMNGG